jgi:hypothetical protein
MQTSTMLRRQRGLCKARGLTGIPYVTYTDILLQHGAMFMLEVGEMQKRLIPTRGQFTARIRRDGEWEDKQTDALIQGGSHVPQ